MEGEPIDHSDIIESSLTGELQPPEMGAVSYQDDHFADASNMVDTASFGDKNNKGRPPPKIRGSQFVKREEKVQTKRWIRVPWIQPKPKILPPKSPQ